MVSTPAPYWALYGFKKFGLKIGYPDYVISRVFRALSGKYWNSTSN
jgi:hypothetical protein